MKRQIVWTVLVLFGVFFSSTAFSAEPISVMKLDAMDQGVADMVTKAIKDEIRNSDFSLAPTGGDVTLPDAQLVAECEETSTECLDMIADFLSTNQLIFGTVESNGDTALTWFKKGVGIEREVNATVGNQKDASRLARRLIQGELGTITVSSGGETGAEVLIDGIGVGLTPFSQEFPVGSHTIQLRKQGFEDSKVKSITLNSNATVAEDFSLVAVEGLQGGLSTMALTGWVMVGTGAAAMIGGTVTGLLVQEKESEAESITNKDRTVDYENVDRYYDLRDELDDYSLMTNIFFSVGGTLTAAGLTLLIIDYLESDTDTNQSASFNFGVAPTQDGGAAFMSYTF